MNNDETRDQELGTAISNLETPGHKPEFFEQVTAQLHATKTKRSSKRLLFTSIATGSVAAAVLAAVLVLPSNKTNTPEIAVPTTTATIPEVTVPQPLLVSQVIEKMNASLDKVTAIKGTADEEFWLYDEKAGTQKTTTAFITSVDGSFRTQRSGTTDRGTYNDVTSYSSKSRVLRTVNAENKTVVNASETTNAIDSFSNYLGIMGRLTSLTRSLSADNDPRLEEITYEGKPAWKITTKFKGDPDLTNPDQVVLIADQAAAFPVSVQMTRKDKPFMNISIRDLQLNPELKESDFTLAFPKGVEVQKSSMPDTRVTLAEAAKRAGYGIPTPKNIPAGFELNSVHYTPEQGVMGSTMELRKVELVYSKGFSSFAVAVWVPENRSDQHDPQAGDITTLTSKAFKVESGDFKGAKAEYVSDIANSARIWGLGNKLGFVVSGDLTPTELTAVVNSLSTK